MTAPSLVAHKSSKRTLRKSATPSPSVFQRKFRHVRSTEGEEEEECDAYDELDEDIILMTRRQRLIIVKYKALSYSNVVLYDETTLALEDEDEYHQNGEFSRADADREPISITHFRKVRRNHIVRFESPVGIVLPPVIPLSPRPPKSTAPSLLPPSSSSSSSMSRSGSRSSKKPALLIHSQSTLAVCQVLASSPRQVLSSPRYVSKKGLSTIELGSGTPRIDTRGNRLPPLAEVDFT